MEYNPTQIKTMVDRYLLEECKVEPMTAREVSQKIRRYDDIANEFIHWLETRSFDGLENPIQVNGYTAAQIHALAPFFDGATVYDFLVDLREQPEWGKQMIKEGFKIR